MDADMRHSALSNAVGDVFQDVSDLVHKEFRFARAEFSTKLNALERCPISLTIA
jgi:hypothetical protein